MREWVRFMLEEIRRKEAEAEAAREERRRRREEGRPEHETDENGPPADGSSRRNA